MKHISKDEGSSSATLEKERDKSVVGLQYQRIKMSEGSVRCICEKADFDHDELSFICPECRTRWNGVFPIKDNLWLALRKKPVVITGIQYTGFNGEQIKKWAENKTGRNDIIKEWKVSYDVRIPTPSLEIMTLEGNVFAIPTDWVLCGVDCEFYPCKDYILKKIYHSTRPERLKYEPL